MRYIPEIWETENLNITDLKEAEISSAQDLFQISSYMNKWDGREYDPNYVRKIFNEGNLPPGQEIIKDLSERFSEMGYQEIRINVSMKNWSALRYWIKSGFNKTTGLYGDLEYSVNNFANIELIKSL